MNRFLPPPFAIKYGGILLVVLGLGFIGYQALVGDTVFTRYYRKYTAHLERNMRLLFMRGSGDDIAAGQGIAALLIAMAGIFFDLPLWYLFVALAGAAPTLYLARRRAEHLKLLEAQVDSFILGLANSMKTVPSPSAALGALAPILPVPTKLEIDRVLKEIRVGSTLELALLNMSSRLKSPNLDSALSAVLIGLQVGGNLPAVLESTASTIREMNRLDGVVKTKTSEGKAQLWVLAVFPFAICFGFSSVEEGYFDPLQQTVTGYIVTSIAMIFWISALLVARKILKVDI